MLSDILSVRYVLLLLFWTGLFLDLECWTRLWFYIHFVFELHLGSQSQHHFGAIWSISNVNRLIDFCVIWVLWLKCITLTLQMFYLFYFCITLFLFFLLILLFYLLLMLLFTHLFNSFRCWCSGSSILFYCRSSVLCCLCCQCSH